MTGTNVAHKDPRKAAVLAKMKRLKEAGATFQESGSGVNFVNFDGNTGKIAYGRDKSALPIEGQRWVAPAELFYHGVTNWQAKKPTDRKRVNILDNPVPPQPPEGGTLQGELPPPHHRDGWAFEVGMRMVGVGAKMDKIEMEFGASAQGQRSAIGNLWAKVWEMAQSPYGEEGFLNPIFEVEVDSYFNTTHDRDIYFPVFKVYDWTDGDILLTQHDPDWRHDAEQALLEGQADQERDFDPLG